MYAVVTGGGTGGHVLPALAVMDRFRDAGWEVRYVGSRAGIERTLVTAPGSIFLAVEGIKGRGILRAFRATFLTGLAVLRMIAMFAGRRPDVVVGVGGFVSVAASVAGRIAGSKLLLQEQNAIPGAATRMLSRLAHRICLGFPAGGASLPPGKLVVTGNPVRAEFLAMPRDYMPPSGGKVTVLVLGGSRGARFINRLMADTSELLDRERFRIVHQTGEADRDGIAARYAAAGVDAQVFAFSNEIVSLLRDAHVVICRSGAMTVTELAAAARPAVLIPFPSAVYDHQALNAAYLVDAGGAVMFREGELSASRMAGLLDGYAARPELLAEMAGRLRSLPVRDAAALIVAEAEGACRV